jgi:hypothetical protein
MVAMRLIPWIRSCGSKTGTYHLGAQAGPWYVLLLLWTIFSRTQYVLGPRHLSAPHAFGISPPASSASSIRQLNYCLSQLAPSQNRVLTLLYISGGQSIHSAITAFLNHPISLKHNTFTFIQSQLRTLVPPGKYLLRFISNCYILILLTSRLLLILFVSLPMLLLGDQSILRYTQQAHNSHNP